MDNYEIITKIGAGACGAVYLVRSHINGRQYALKKVQLDERKRTRTRDALLREAGILSKLEHPHIVAYHDSFFAGNKDLHYIHIIQDYCNGGTLEDKIIQMRKHVKQCRFLPAASKSILKNRQSWRILHRDLKSQNVFMTKSDGVKLGDFGIAKVLDGTLDAAVTCVGTPCYLSPELCQDIPYSSKADIWALGCLLFELCALKPAFDASNLISLFYKITKAEYSDLPKHYSTELKGIISSLLVKEPENRPSAGAILNMVTIRNYLETFIQDREYLLKQKIITLKAKSTSKAGSTSTSPVPQGRPSCDNSLSSTVRHSTPVIRTQVRPRLSKLRKSYSPEDVTGKFREEKTSEVTSCSAGDRDRPTKFEPARSPDEEAKQLSPNYSDDFDSAASSSETDNDQEGEREEKEEEVEEEEIPEEMSVCTEEYEDSGNADLCNGVTPSVAASGAEQEDDLLSYYDEDDFEEDSEAEELDKIIAKAKEAHTLSPLVEDDFFVDEDAPPLSKNKQSLREYLKFLEDYDESAKN